MVSVIYQKRAIPLLWVVVSGCKGHFPADTHVEVLTRLQQLLPETASVVVLGDGEFDSVALQTFLAQAGWDYVCRTAKNTQVCLDGAWLSLAEIAVWPGVRLLLGTGALYRPGLRSRPGRHLVGSRPPGTDLSDHQSRTRRGGVLLVSPPHAH